MPVLHIIMYHYVRDVGGSAYPGLKALGVDDFRSQLQQLTAEYEMATIESSLAFIAGRYTPPRSLCLLTFDDGLTEHAREVTAQLAENNVQGLFFPITSCVEDRRVAPVHMNHLLMASLGFAAYSREFLAELTRRDSHALTHATVDDRIARRTYIWDTPDVAAFKYLFNFVLDATTRDEIVQDLFKKHIGPQSQIADDLYFTWEEAREMQAAGMVIGGHSHSHRPLSALTSEALTDDLAMSRRLLERNLRPQPVWPFSYPYGKATTTSGQVIGELTRLGFDCAFTTEAGANAQGADCFLLRRVDCKQACVAGVGN